MEDVIVKGSDTKCKIKGSFFIKVQELAKEGKLAKYIESALTPQGCYAGFKVNNMHQFLQILYPDVIYESAFTKIRSKISAGIKLFDMNFTLYALQFEPFNNN